MLLADPLLARRLEEAESAAAAEAAETLRRLDPQADAEVLEVAGGIAVYLAPGMPLNRAVGLGMGRPVSAAEIAAVEEFYRRHGVVPRIDLCPLADRSLQEGLGPRGYAIARVFNTHVRAVAPSEAVPAIPDVRVREAGPDEAELWAQTVARGFLGRDDAADSPALELARLTVRRPSVRAFLALAGDEPIAAGALAVRDGLALLFSDSTRDEYRNLGANRALLGARLAAAADAGCDLACAAAPPGSTTERNVMDAGFRHAYSRMLMVREWP